MLKEYRKTATIKAEQFDGSIKQITRYKVHIVGPTSRGDTSYFLIKALNCVKKRKKRRSTVRAPL